jgi:hypothetical protein
MPFVVDNANCQVLAVVVQRASGLVEQYVSGHDGVSLDAAAGTITISGAGAAPFLATDTDYFVYVCEQEKAYDLSADAYRTEEIAPLNDEFTAPAYDINEPSVTSGAPLAWAFAPSANGVVIDGYKDINFQLYLKGGQKAGVDCTLTVKFQGCNDLDAGSGNEWVDLGVGYDLTNDGTQTSWVSIGNTVLGALVDFENWQQRRIRVAYVWNTDPDANDPGAIVINHRLKAL